MFNVGDRVRRTHANAASNDPRLRVGAEFVVARVEYNEWFIDGDGVYHHKDYLERVATAEQLSAAREQYRLPVRNTDPDTSKAVKPRIVSLRVQVLTQIQQAGADGLTGHELCAILDAKLNSVTPRFAELRNLYIKDSGQRRDGQIVWVAR